MSSESDVQRARVKTIFYLLPYGNNVAELLSGYHYFGGKLLDPRVFTTVVLQQKRVTCQRVLL